MRELFAVTSSSGKLLHWKCSRCDWAWPASGTPQMMNFGSARFHEHTCALVKSRQPHEYKLRRLAALVDGTSHVRSRTFAKNAGLAFPFARASKFTGKRQGRATYTHVCVAAAVEATFVG